MVTLLQNSVMQLQKGLIDMENMFELLERRSAVQDLPSAKPLTVSEGALRVRCGSDAHPTNGARRKWCSLDGRFHGCQELRTSCRSCRSGLRWNGSATYNRK